MFYHGGEIYRALSAAALDDWERISGKRFFREGVASGKIVSSARLPAEDPAAALAGDEWPGVLHHQKIPFISYPYEWSFGMLQDAALLHLELFDAALDEDVTIKDATAYNVQWLGTRPVFIDIPSFQPLPPGEPWVGYRQFCQTFLFPLLLNAYKNVQFQPYLRGRLDGIEPDQCAGLLSARDLLRPGVLGHVYLHAKLQSGVKEPATSMRQALPRAGFAKGMIKANVQGLKRTVRGLRWKAAESSWSGYAACNTYSPADRETKERFVRQAAGARRRRLVWDLGCNTGQFSRIAAETADVVVAMDSDALSVDRLYRTLKAEGNATILPLVGNVADPSPNQGWRCAERKGLAERGTPDLTLCLALIHHLVIGANLPLSEFIDWLAGLRTDLVIEFVTKADPMVQSLLRNKPDIYADYELEYFEGCLARAFDVVERRPLESGTRILYWGKSRSRE